MSLPALITVKGTIRNSAGPQSGRLVWIRSTAVRPTNPTDETFSIPEEVVTVVDATGEFEQPIYSTNDPAASPTGWTWEVRPHFPHWRTPFSVSIPYDSAGGEINFAQLAPVPDDGDGDLYALVNHTHSGGGGGSSVSWDDVLGKPTTFAPSAHTHDWADVTGEPATFPPSAHTHDDRYYTEAEVDALIAAVEGGGGGGTAVTRVIAFRTAGDVIPTADAAFALLANPRVSLAAAVGDQIELQVNCMIDFNGSALDFYDIAVIVGGAIVRSASNNNAIPATEGDPALYPDQDVRFTGKSTSMAFVAEAGDISGGTITFGVAHKGAGTGAIKASASYPFRWTATNFGPSA